MAAHNVPQVMLIPAHLTSSGSRVPAKVQCENCDSMISVPMIERHRGSKTCAEMKKWREKQKKHPHRKTIGYTEWM